ncbi:helix-turn-helix transcriptional regulator [Pseudonocardia spinosispora]|uniref:helix-turn-helix transcriptional regulator n=1 Tax=Pseudonocardia spinosispora TaxID=103441 RepID=UPI0004062497|nr:LuxR family transcriptional regulator [Pseudonocardia spinosispora]
MPSLIRPDGSLVGRRDEVRAVESLVAATRGGLGGALVLRGEAGIGKSALLDHAQAAVPEFQVLRASGSEFESELPFAALQQLCRPLSAPSLGYFHELSVRHRDVLRVAFGLAAGPPSAFRVGLAVLELLACAARRNPVLCLVDDAQWLDDASSRALAFIARRIGVEPVAMVLAVRLPGSPSELDELPGLVVSGLGDSDARALLASKGQAMLDEQVRDRLLAEARGNPLALLQLPRPDGFALSATSALQTRIEQGFEARLVGLPVEARQLLTIASADPTGDPALLWPAAQRMGVDVTATSAIVSGTGLVEFSTRVRFCHPLARSTVYLTADADQRRLAHWALAEVTDPATDPDRRAWHRARASSGPDEDVAEELEQSATRAHARGGVVAAAAFIERAAQLSLDPAKRRQRTLAAAKAKFYAGALDTASELLTVVEHSDLDVRQQAEVDLVRGQIAFLRRHDADGPRFMIRAGQRLAELDPQHSRNCFVDALEMSFVAGRPSGAMEMVLAAAQSAAKSSRSAEHPPDIIDALALLTTRGHHAAAPLLRTILDGTDTPLWTRRPALAVMVAAGLWDPHARWAIINWLLKAGRESGSPIILRLGLAQLASESALEGDIGRAMSAIAEEEALADATGGEPVYYPRLQLAALRGRRDEALDVIEKARTAAIARGSGQLIANVHWATAVLHNGLADYPAALAAAKQAAAHNDVFLSAFALPELVEAAVRCGEYDTANTALEALTERTDASGTAMGLGTAAYVRALVTGNEDDYQESLHHLRRSPLVPFRARGHLLYGEWLRREGRRKDCRLQLHTAHELLSASGTEAFARRAADELRATGAKARSRTDQTHDQLTMQELHIARLVATGVTSNEVAARLFISPRTVDAHLRNIFRKLSIKSRRQLKEIPGIYADQASWKAS